MSNQKQDWIWLMSLVVKYSQTHDKNDTKAIEFWNWAVEYYQVEEFEVIEIENEEVKVNNDEINK